MQLAEFLRGQAQEGRVALSFDEVERILGSPLPASASKLRVWWSNDKTHAQARYGWLSAGWVVEDVDLEKKVVVFRQAGWQPEATATDEAHVSKILSRYFGVNLHVGVRMKARLKSGGEIEESFDLASADGRVIGEVMRLSAGKVPAARFPAISESTWILEKIDADVKFIAFVGDPRVPRLWLERYRRLVDGVRFLYIGRDGKIEELA